MYSVKALLFVLLNVGSLAAPARPDSLNAVGMANSVVRRSTPSSQGMNNGMFYSVWSDGTGDVEYNNGGAGQYSLTWTNVGDVVVGKGFQTGAPRNITYNADYEPTGISFLSVYGWFTDPLTEYYICENYGTSSPALGDGMIHKGQLESDGSTYDVYEHQQVNAPSIQGVTNFQQYWSIRADRRSSGTINTANHYNYWKSIGLPIGTFGYQILATEGFKSSGKSVVTVSEGAAPDTDSDAAAVSSSVVASPSVAASSSVVAPSVAAPSPVAVSSSVAPPPPPVLSSSTAPSSPSSASSVAPTVAPVYPLGVAVTTVFVTTVVETVEVAAGTPRAILPKM